MSSQWDQLKSLIGISAGVSIYGIVSLLIWFLGPSFGFGVTERILLIALILLTWPFFILFNHYRKKREEKRRSGSESAQSEEQPISGRNAQVSGRNAQERKYDELARGAEEAVQWLRSTKLSTDQSRDAVYSLPW